MKKNTVCMKNTTLTYYQLDTNFFNIKTKNSKIIFNLLKCHFYATLRAIETPFFICYLL